MVAWLHEVFEYTTISEEALLAEGVATDELRALRLLTRDNASRADSIYLAHIELLARARGPGAGIARSVKRADLADRVLHPATRTGGWSPPYERGLALLLRMSPLDTPGPPPSDARGRSAREPGGGCRPPCGLATPMELRR